MIVDFIVYYGVKMFNEQCVLVMQCTCVFDWMWKCMLLMRLCCDVYVPWLIIEGICCWREYVMLEMGNRFVIFDLLLYMEEIVQEWLKETYANMMDGNWIEMMTIW